MAESEDKTTKHCKHYVLRKKRYCRMFVRVGEEFCGEHQPLPLPSSTESINKEDEASGTKLRIVCPLDPKHTCYASNLKKHLKICNARPKESEPFILKGVNCGDLASTDSNEPYKLLSSFPVQEISEVVKKITKLYEDSIIVDSVTENFLTHQIVEEEMSKPEYGDRTKKHLKQASSILGLLSKYELIKPNTCYIEFGAGRGHLSYWLSKATESTEGSSFLLIERSSPKHKRDNKLDKSEEKVQRIRADIADLVLEKLDAINKTGGVVGVTKHLCGDATDLAIRCLNNISQEDKVRGCLMTFCCHHRCRWGSYTGKKYFEQIGVNKNDFDMMCGMTSWATCGSGFSRERQIEEKALVVVQNDRDEQIGLDRTQKAEIGKKCKNLINWGRLKYLEEFGFQCLLHYYVKPDVSLENVCIIAHK